jgi:MinD-like ATPase involved in chromosome partitioning or flagellar assembly
MYSIENKYIKEVEKYCKLNDIEDIEKFLNKCFKRGYDLEIYGILGESTKIVEKEIIKEVVKEVPGPIQEIKIIEYVDREVVKEVPGPVQEIKVIEYVNREVVKEIPVIMSGNNDTTKMDMLQITLIKLKKEINEKNQKIEELEKIVYIKPTEENKTAVYMNGSNLKKTL